MIEMTLHELEKETDNKLRWDADVGEALFELYIPKWTVPTPWPLKILVKIDSVQTGLITNEACNKGNDKALSIIAIAEKYKKHTKTVRYIPVGEKQDWQIGEPYIPYSLLPESADT